MTEDELFTAYGVEVSDGDLTPHPEDLVDNFVDFVDNPDGERVYNLVRNGAEGVGR